MARHFNTAGPCELTDHYMLPPEARIRDLRPLIDSKAYFVIHAPRQTGKTTFILWLAKSLTAGGRYSAVDVNCKPAATTGDDVERGVNTVIEAIYQSACNQLPDGLQPGEPAQAAGITAELRLLNYLSNWCQQSPRPVVLLFDEIDAMRDGTLLSVLNQLSAGYSLRPSAFLHSLALIGLRDIRDYKIRRSNERGYAGTSSPFNIKSDSLRLRDFTSDEVAALYQQHTEETGQELTAEVKARAFELTRGQPWLVNALARQLVEEEVPDPGTTVESHHLDAAKEALIQRRDTHLDSLIDRLSEPRVRRVIEPILNGGLVTGSGIGDDVSYVEDLGLVYRSDDGSLCIANPIYQEIIPRALASEIELAIPAQSGAFVTADGLLDMPALLDAFVAFWIENAEELLEDQVYPELRPT